MGRDEGVIGEEDRATLPPHAAPVRHEAETVAAGGPGGAAEDVTARDGCRGSGPCCRGGSGRAAGRGGSAAQTGARRGGRSRRGSSGRSGGRSRRGGGPGGAGGVPGRRRSPSPGLSPRFAPPRPRRAEDGAGRGEPAQLTHQKAGHGAGVGHCRNGLVTGSMFRPGGQFRGRCVEHPRSHSYDCAVSMIRLNDILTQVKSYHPDPDLDVIKKAYVYSAKVHQGQLRRSGEPYLVHPLEVAGILADLKLDEASVVTGLLHDTIEDTLATPDELTELFGPEVTRLVDGVTKLSKFQASATLSQEEKQAENFRKMIIAMAQDIRVILVKLADRTHNMRT